MAVFPDSEASALNPEGFALPLPHFFGDYELIEEIARGGMGVVYRARQISLNRLIALKMVLAGEFASPAVLRRFHQEAKAAASLQHPHIIAIHEISERDSHTYFTMDLVEGRTLAERAREQPLPVCEVALLVQKISEAVHYAHEHGILHRDLKPSNIIVDTLGQPRITDFGLARSINDARDLTETGQALGSPAYISPEQAFDKRNAIGPASDIYSLGAVLYHLLTGRPPFLGETVHDVLLQVKSAEPLSLRRLNPSVPLDLETICLKCLEKDPTRRYPSAQALADELGRFLRREPIHARPAGALGKLWRWCRRRPAIAALSASVLLLLALVTASSIVAAWRVAVAQRAEHKERGKAETANRGLLVANARLGATVNQLELQRAEDLFRASDPATGLAHLAQMLRANPSNHIAASRLVSALVHRTWALPAAQPMRHLDRVQTVCFSPDGRHVLSASWDKTAQVWDTATGKSLATVRHGDAVLFARYNSAGDRFVTASADGTARVWNATNGQALTPALHHGSKVFWAEFSPVGRSIVTAADRTARFWDADSGELKREFSGSSSELHLARFSPDGQSVATGSGSGSVRIWSVTSDAPLFILPMQRGAVQTLAFSPDGNRLVSAYAGGTAQLWDARSGAAVRTPVVHKDSVHHVAFSPDGQLFATASEDRTVRLWNATDGTAVGDPFIHDADVRFVEFSPDGKSLLTAALDGSARLWDVLTRLPLSQPMHEAEQIMDAGFSPNGEQVVTASLDSVVQVWNVRPRNSAGLSLRHEDVASSVHFSPDGESIITTSRDRTARLWATRTGQPLCPPLVHDAGVNSAEFSPDGKLFATGSWDGKVRVFETNTRRQITDKIHHAKDVSVHFSPDGEHILTGSADGTARVWNALTGQPITPPLQHDGEILSASFSPDGRFVLTASRDWSARVWNAKTGEPVTARLTHIDQVRWAEFSPNGQRIVTASADNHAGIWDIRTSQLAAPPLKHTRTVERAVFSPDGQQIATASLDRTARVWDANTGQALTPPLWHDNPVSHISFSPDGRRLLTASWNGQARVWDSNTGRPLTEWLGAGARYVFSACFDPSGNRIALAGMAESARVWNVPPVPTPVPAWLPELAEAVAGTRLSVRGNVETVGRNEFQGMADRFSLKDTTEFYERLARWFFADPAQRAVDPF